MKILFLTPRLPLPADTGAKIRTFNLLKNTAVQNKVTLLSFYFEENNRAVEELRGLGIEVHLVKANEQIKPAKIFSHLPVSIQKYRSEELTKKLQELLGNTQFDVVHFDHLHMGQYIDQVNGLPAILDEHNVESVILSRCAEIEKSLAKRIIFKSQAKKMKRFEGRLVTKFSKCLVVSENDKQNLYELSGRKANIEVISNGVDTEYFSFRDSPLRGQSLEDTLVFTGSMDWLPNHDAVIYFCKEILPLIWAKNSQVKFYIIGKNPKPELKNLAKHDERIVVTGSVKDVRPYLAKTKVFVAPIRIGGGTRLKILEAMAMERVVVSTSIGAEGLQVKPGEHILLADTPVDFSRAVLKLLDDQSLRQALGINGRKLIEEQYDWKYIGSKVEAVYKSAHV